MSFRVNRIVLLSWLFLLLFPPAEEFGCTDRPQGGTEWRWSPIHPVSIAKAAIRLVNHQRCVNRHHYQPRRFLRIQGLAPLHITP